MLLAPFYFLCGLILFTVVGLPVGAFIGWCAGRFTRRIFPWRHSGPVFNLFDLPIGYLGLLAGLEIAYAGYTRTSIWESGQIVYEHTTGFGDYAIPIALFAAAFTVVFWNLSVGVGKSAFQKLTNKPTTWFGTFAAKCRERFTSKVKWTIAHGALRLMVVVNVGLLVSELIREPGHVHSSLRLLAYAALWLSVSAVALPIYAAIEEWWRHKTGAVDQTRAVILDLVFALAWAITFLTTAPLIWSSW
jgi:hypothetical protein